MVRLLEHWGQFAHFAWRGLGAALRALTWPGELARQLHGIFLGALPLALVAGLTMGVVVWIHLHGVVSKEYLRKVPEYLTLAVVLEFAPLGAGLVVAGRSGASLGAELAAMRQSEQIDALEVLGQSPMHYLVGPRVLACMLTLPLLTVLIAYVAIGSSFLAEMLGGTLSWTQYQADVQRGLVQAKALPATLKTVVFGFLVGTTGCFFGMRAGGGTEGVGHAATRGVVVATFLVLIANVFLVKLIQVAL